MNSLANHIFRNSRMLAGLLVLSVSLSAQSAKPLKHPAQASRQPPPGPTVEQDYVLVGAGDIVGCRDPRGAQATAKLVEKIPGTVFALGDLVYDAGTLAAFQVCYGTSWAKFKDRTKPALGNHEYLVPHAAPYFAYWGAQAGPADKGYYSYDLGVWHVVVLNTNCDAAGVGGCNTGSPQELWLKNDLSEHANSCIVAYGHHALFSSGFFRSHAIHPELKPLWVDLYAAHADLMLAGHEHSYERFAPQDPQGRPDPLHGIREIVVGTGGRSHDPLGLAVPNSEVRNTNTFGILKVILSPHAYTWEFIPEEGGAFQDSGSGICHNRAAQQAEK